MARGPAMALLRHTRQNGCPDDTPQTYTTKGVPGGATWNPVHMPYGARPVVRVFGTVPVVGTPGRVPRG